MTDNTNKKADYSPRHSPLYVHIAEVYDEFWTVQYSRNPDRYIHLIGTLPLHPTKQHAINHAIDAVKALGKGDLKPSRILIVPCVEEGMSYDDMVKAKISLAKLKKPHWTLDAGRPPIHGDSNG